MPNGEHSIMLILWCILSFPFAIWASSYIRWASAGQYHTQSSPAGHTKESSTQVFRQFHGS